MGKFDKFKGKGNSKKNNILKVNKYENKDVVLDLISYISTAEAVESSNSYFTPLIEKVNSFDKIMEAEHPDYSWIKKNSYNLSFDLWCTLTDVIESLDDNYGTPTVKIAVAGGYSAGKSTFLNYLIGDKELLPTGVDPISIVNTHLTMVPSTSNIMIRGRNLKNGFVPLDKGVLQTIKHSSNSSVHVASVLQSLHIDCPVKDNRLTNVTFIDTPGYNNSSYKNAENSTTDRATALNQLKQADGIVWCVDIEKGVVPKDDINFLRDVQEVNPKTPIIVIFTKRHKKEPESVQLDILSKTKDQLKKELREPESLYCVCAFSIDKPIPFLNRDINFLGIFNVKGTDFYNFLDHCRNLTGVSNYKSFVQNEVSRIIENAQKSVNDLLSELENDRREISKSKSDEFSELTEERQNIESFKYIINHYIKTSTQRDYSSVQKDWMYDEIAGVFDWKLNLLENRYNSVKDDYKTVCESIGDLTRYKESLKKFKNDITVLFESCYASFIRSSHSGKSYVGSSQNNTDIFSAIAAGNMSRFTDCLSAGIDLAICNSQGYNPLTYCVAYGRIEMLRYMLENGAPADITDNRGYNPFETAVIVHSRALCELLLTYNKDLRRTNTPLDKLIKQNTFENWIKTIK